MTSTQPNSKATLLPQPKNKIPTRKEPKETRVNTHSHPKPWHALLYKSLH